MLGHGEETEEVTPRVVEALLGRDVRQISCGTEHILAVTCKYSSGVYILATLYFKILLRNNGTILRKSMKQ